MRRRFRLLPVLFPPALLALLLGLNAPAVRGQATPPPHKAATGPQGPPGTPGAAGSPGTPGTNGTNGSPGAAATVSVGATTTGAAGTSASVTNTGTTSAAVLAFTIPRGANGSDGAPGQAGAAGPNWPIKGGGTTLTSTPSSLNFTAPLVWSVSGNDVTVGYSLTSSAIVSALGYTPQTPLTAGTGIAIASGVISDTLATGTQAANTVYAGPASGSAAVPGFRGLVSGDLPYGSVFTGDTSFKAFGGSPVISIQDNNGTYGPLVQFVTGQGGFDFYNYRAFVTNGNDKLRLTMGNSGATRLAIDSNASSLFNFITSRIQVSSGQVTDAPLTLLMIAGQTAAAEQVKTSAGTVVQQIDASGNETAQSYTSAGGYTAGTTAGTTATIPTSGLVSLKVTGGLVVGFTDGTGYHGN